MSAQRWHLVCYDIRESKRLRAVAQKPESYGQRIQYSVFRCRLSRREMEKLHWELNQIMSDVDDLLVVPVCVRCASQVPNHSTGDQSDWVDGPPTFDII